MQGKPERRGIHVTAAIKGHIVHFFLTASERDRDGGETREGDGKMREGERREGASEGGEIATTERWREDREKISGERKNKVGLKFIKDTL